MRSLAENKSLMLLQHSITYLPGTQLLKFALQPRYARSLVLHGYPLSSIYHSGLLTAKVGIFASDLWANCNSICFCSSMISLSDWGRNGFIECYFWLQDCASYCWVDPLFYPDWGWEHVKQCLQCGQCCCLGRKHCESPLATQSTTCSLVLGPTHHSGEVQNSGHSNDQLCLAI